METRKEKDLQLLVDGHGQQATIFIGVLLAVMVMGRNMLQF